MSAPVAVRHAILPGRATAGVPLTAVMAIMSYLAVLALAAALALNHATHAWSSNLAGAVTIQIRADADMTPDAQRDGVLALLKDKPGIKAARALSDQEIAKLLEPWLGKGLALDTLPVPQLIDVTLDRSAPAELTALGTEIAAKVPGATLDDHRSWNARLVRFSDKLSGIGLAVLAVTALATIAIVVFATRSGLAANHETVEVLHLVGAQDSFIAGQFQRHFLLLALKASLIGLGAAVATLLVVGLVSEKGGAFLPDVALKPLDPVILLAVPISAALVAMATARFTVLGVLKNMP